MSVLFWVVGALVLAAVASSTTASASSVSSSLVSPNGTKWVPLDPEWIQTGINGVAFLDYWARDLVGPGERITVLFSPENHATWIQLSGVVQSRQMRRPIDNLLVVRFDQVSAADSSKDAPVFSQLPTLPTAILVSAQFVYNTVPPKASEPKAIA